MLVIMLNKFTILRSSVTKVSPDYPWPWEGAPDIAGSGRRATAPRVWKPATESLKLSHKKKQPPVIIQLVWREDTTWPSWEDGGAWTFPTRSGKKNKETKDSAQ